MFIRAHIGLNSKPFQNVIFYFVTFIQYASNTIWTLNPDIYLVRQAQVLLSMSTTNFPYIHST